MQRTTKVSAAALAAALFVTLGVQAGSHDGAAATPNATVTVDYAQTTAVTSKYVFGISSWPRMNPAYATMLADAGITMIRQSSIGMQDIVPTTTVADYLNNVGNVQDPSTWNWNPTGSTETIHEDDVDAFNNAGIDVFSIIAVTPSWLGVSANPGAVPSNWAVYEDIVKKIYLHYKDKIRNFEIYNEPEFEVLRGTYPDRWAAYADLYKHALDAINSVDPLPGRTPVGGPAGAFTADYTWVNTFLSDVNYGDDVDFMSYHCYGDTSTYDTGVYDWKNAAAANGKPNLPLFVSEYNKGGGENTSTAVISWIGAKLSVLMDAGVTGAFLYGTDDRATGLNATVRHSWYIVDQSGALMPRVWPIRLLSKQLALGEGDNDMKLTQQTGLTWASAAVNSDGMPVVWAVNDTASSVTADLTLNNTGLTGPVTLTHYLASAGNDATSAYASETRTAIDGTVTTTVTLPARSVYGIAVDPAAGPVAESIWGAAGPTSTWYNNTSWELGTRFQPTVAGEVTAIKVYSTSQESGNHTARIWNNATGAVIGGPYTFNYGGTAGWKYYTLPTAVSLSPGTEYTVSVSTGADTHKYMPLTAAGATTAGTNSNHLSYPANATVYSTTLGSRPTSSSGNNYLRDVNFVPTGNVNIASGKTATASSTYGTGFEASKAVDGLYFADNINNTWATNATHVNAWWKVDFGSSTPLKTVKIQFRGYPNASSQLVFQQVPASITFQVSNDNSTWTTVVSKSTNVPTVGTPYNQQLYSYTLNTTGRYLRLLFEDGSQGGTWATLDELVELEAYAY